MKNAALMCIAMALFGCESEPVDYEVVGEENNELANCNEPPEVDLEEVEGSQPKGSDVVVSSYVYLDEECPTVTLVGIKLFFQQSTAGSDSLEEVSMTRGSNLDEWRGTIPSRSLGSAYMRYYVKAFDSAGNEAVVPTGADTDTLKASTFNVATE